MIGIFSRGIRDIPHLTSFLGEQVIFRPCGKTEGLTKIAGWGVKPSAQKARRFAEKHSLPYISLEDGFLRSYGLGVKKYPPLSLAVDDIGIYYDATRPSRLERILNNGSLSDDEQSGAADQAIHLIKTHGLSKYNHAPGIDCSLIKNSGRKKVLVVDQTRGDMSVTLGMADDQSFRTMLDAARSENPEADLYIKIHPDVVAGKKQGYLTRLRADPNTVILRHDMNPVSLVQLMDRVYVVTSQLGFEALLYGKPVSCFGAPFYSGWGVTDDRVAQPRRIKKRSVTEIFVAAYMKYCCYINPLTGGKGTIFDVIEHINRQKRYADQNRGKFFFFGFRPWKYHYIRSFFQGSDTTITFSRSMRNALGRGLDQGCTIAVWGHNEPKGLREYASSRGVAVWRIEDGFIRSLGLGSDLVRPMSLVLDTRGIYYDCWQESDIEHILNTYPFSTNLCIRSERLIQKILKGKITKYNTERLVRLAIAPDPGRNIIFVPGQVEDDASIRYGTTNIRTNLSLLAAVRRRDPDAFIVYKPHPDVMAKNRKGKVALQESKAFCDHIETVASVISCIEQADEVHTMTSLTGFDALLRGKKVVTYGGPFYAGWGLTEDNLTFPRRTRWLSLNELVAGALLLYPRYVDEDTKSFVECETIVDKIIIERRRMEDEGRLGLLQPGYLRRQALKAKLFFKGWFNT